MSSSSQCLFCPRRLRASRDVRYRLLRHAPQDPNPSQGALQWVLCDDCYAEVSAFIEARGLSYAEALAAVQSIVRRRRPRPRDPAQLPLPVFTRVEPGLSFLVRHDAQPTGPPRDRDDSAATA